MKDQNKIDPIKAQILALKAKQAYQLVELKQQLEITAEQLKPINLIRNTFSEMTRTPDIKSHLLQGVIAIAGGYLSKKLVIGGSTNILKQIGGTLLQFFITKKIVQKESEILNQDQLPV